MPSDDHIAGTVGKPRHAERQRADDDEEGGDEYGVFSFSKGELLPLTLVFEVQNRSGRPTEVSGAYLAVESSVSDLQPAIQLNRDLGQCGSFAGNMTDPSGNLAVTGALCVMPLENAGDFKTILILAQVPAAESATLTQLAQQIFASYNVPVAYLQTLLKPWDQTAGRPVVIMNPVSTQCFEMAVLHGAPQSQLPGACGGTAP